MVDYQLAFNIAFSLAGGGVGFYVLTIRDELRSMKHDYKNLSQSITVLREAIPQRYATTDDLREQAAHNDAALNRAMARYDLQAERLFQALGRIEAKIDTKADK